MDPLTTNPGFPIWLSLLIAFLIGIGFGFALDNPNFVIEFNDNDDSIVNKGEKFIFFGPDEYHKHVQQIIAKLESNFNVQYDNIKITVKKNVEEKAVSRFSKLHKLKIKALKNS